MSELSVSGHFIDGPSGPIFVLLRRPRGSVRGCVLVVPPFAEEMNKCRRMITEVAIAAASRGIAVVVPDLSGTGDSAGDFADARWDTWGSDLQRTSEWSAAEGMPVTRLLAIRLGASLALAACESGQLPATESVVLWQPVFDGPRFLTQFLRLRVAASLMMEDRSENVATLRASLTDGALTEVAGYALSGQLAQQLDSLVAPAQLPRMLGAVHWMELVRGEGSQLPKPSQDLIQRSRTVGVVVTVDRFEGEPFWSSTEIVTNPAMVSATVDALTGAGTPAVGMSDGRREGGA